MRPRKSGISLRILAVEVCVAALCSWNAAAQLAVVPTTTLNAETQNNTSATSTFRAQTNGNAAASNVSKLSMRTLLYQGSTTKVFAAVMPWFGRTDHMSIGYTSSDPKQIKRQVDYMLSRGIQGAIIPWYGRDIPINSETAINYMAEANSRGGAFEFAIMIDVGDVVAYAKLRGCDVTKQLTDDLNYIAQTFYGSAAYSRVSSRPVVYFFDVDQYYIDWNQLRNSVAGNPMFLKRNTGGFNAPQSNGAYSWVEINFDDANDMMLAYLDDFYNNAAQNPGKYAVGSTYKGFNDTLADWGANRIVNQQCARTWLATFDVINQHYSKSNQLKAVQLTTFNDYEEGTEMETGIDNCVEMTATISGSTLAWDIGPLGNEDAIHHYTVFISKDGQNLMPLADVPTGTHSLNLLNFNLGKQTYILYVQAVGKAAILNHMSRALAFDRTNQAPTATLTLNPASGVVPLPVTASGAASSDADGSIVSGAIDFGDGTVVPSLTATHTYTKAGKYTVVLTITDNGGVFASTQGIVTVGAGPGVTIASPSSGATVGSQVHVVATALMDGGVSYMEVLIDGKTPPVYVVADDKIDTYLKVDSGTHELRVVAHSAIDANNFIYADSTIHVASDDVPPTALLSMNPFGNTTRILACTAASYDEDGFVTGSIIDFGDGSTGIGPSVVHDYQSPGTYTVTALVVDNAGSTSTTTMELVVGNWCAEPTSPGVKFCSPTNGAAVDSPFVISVAGKNTNGTSGLDVWLDGQKLGWFPYVSTLNIQITGSPGSHQLDVYAVGYDDEKQFGSVTFTVNGGACAVPNSAAVNICAPASGTTVSSPVHIAAAGSTGATMYGLDVWLDGNKVGWFPSNMVDTYVNNVAAGQHTLDIYAVGDGTPVKGTSIFWVQ